MVGNKTRNKVVLQKRRFNKSVGHLKVLIADSQVSLRVKFCLRGQISGLFGGHDEIVILLETIDV